MLMPQIIYTKARADDESQDQDMGSLQSPLLCKRHVTVIPQLCVWPYGGHLFITYVHDYKCRSGLSHNLDVQ